MTISNKGFFPEPPNRRKFSKLPAKKSISNSSNYRIILLAAIAVLLSGCATTTDLRQITTLASDNPSPRILLMPPDVELAILTAGGLSEPQDQWTESARRYLLAAIQNIAAERNAVLVPFKEDPAAINPIEHQLRKLHQVVGQSILTHKYGTVPLPTKQNHFDWSLGVEANQLRHKYDADYALFVFVRDSYASGGRIAYQLTASLIGIGVPGGFQIGFASLVDLRTGDIVWFNQLARGVGDLRTQSEASETAQVLLARLPGA